MTMFPFVRQQWRNNKLINLQDKLINNAIRGVVKEDWRLDREESRTYRLMLRQEALKHWARRRKHLRLNAKEE